MVSPAVARRAAAMTCLLLLCMVKPRAGQRWGVFDVTSYGAKADGTTENSKAFLAAWKDACGYAGNATLVIPNGTFLLGPIVFQGPCYNLTSPVVEFQGTVKALPRFSGCAWIEFHRLHELTVGGGGTLDGQGSQSWGHGHDLPVTLKFMDVSNATASNLSLVDSKGFHVSIHMSTSVAAHDLNITAPADSPNTDGIHISKSYNVSITDSSIGTGDDCISVGEGSTNVSVSRVFCGPGHGLSVGSLGKYLNEEPVTGLRATNCTVSGTVNGLRIKTWPGSAAGSASNITFEDIIVDNASNPIIIDQQYCRSHDGCSSKPSLVKITGVTFRRIRGTTNTEAAVVLQCSEARPCEGVQLEDIDLTYVNGTSVSRCSNAMGGVSGTQNPAACL